jgi:hypothetical protein
MNFLFESRIFYNYSLHVYTTKPLHARTWPPRNSLSKIVTISPLPPHVLHNPLPKSLTTSRHMFQNHFIHFSYTRSNTSSNQFYIITKKVVSRVYISIHTHISITKHYSYSFGLNTRCLANNWLIIKWLTSSSAQYARCDAMLARSEISNAYYFKSY